MTTGRKPRTDGGTRAFLLAGALAGALALSACETAPLAPPTPGLIESNYTAADRLMALSSAPITPGVPVIVTTLADNDRLTASSPLGRLVAEQMASRLATQGYAVTEVRMANALSVRDGTGELILSRDARELGRASQAQAIVAGTYTLARTQVFLSAKLLRAEDGRVLSAVDWQVPMTEDIQALTRGMKEVPVVGLR